MSKYKHLENVFKKSIICGETNECLNFGINKRLDFLLFNSIKENLQYITDVSKLNEGSNGDVYAVKFVKTFENKNIDLTFNTILKTSKYRYADNLVYEYIVGKKFINVFSEYYPNFLLTYDLFDISKNKINKENISTSLEPIDDTTIKEIVKYSCVKPESMSILIQHFENCDTIHEPKKREHMKKSTPNVIICYCFSITIYIYIYILYI